MYTYIKQPALTQEQQIRLLKKHYRLERIKRLLPTIFITLGASLIISVVFPILSYEFNVFKNNSKRTQLISPVPDEQLSEIRGFVSPMASSVKNQPSSYTNQAPPALAAQTADSQAESTVDYTDIDNWFPFEHPQDSAPSSITHYTITIPSVKIKDAVVTVGGHDLEKSLIHYGGTALPGQLGNAVVFGHSVLPSFYNPKNYISIFSLIPTLKSKDQILIHFDGIVYQYLVTDYYEVSPSEIDILQQRYDRKELTLVTCVPPGTYWKRGIIKAQLASVQ